MKDEKRKNFVRLVNARLNRCVKQIKLIQKMVRSSSYDVSKDDVDRIIESLESEALAIRSSFEIRPKAPKELKVFIS